MTRDLRTRIAKALGWTQAEVGQFSLPALRDLVRPVDPALASDIGDVVAGRKHWTVPRGHAAGSKASAHSKGAMFNVILTFLGREQVDMDIPVDKQTALSDVFVLERIFRSMKLAERADLLKVSIALHGDGKKPLPKTWISGSHYPRQFFFGKNMLGKTDRGL